jgi:hypothetical protein
MSWTETTTPRLTADSAICSVASELGTPVACTGT